MTTNKPAGIDIEGVLKWLTLYLLKIPLGFSAKFLSSAYQGYISQLVRAL